MLLFYLRTTTLSLSGSNMSLSSASLGHDGTSVTVDKLRCLISSGSTASAPYINQNGLKFCDKFCLNALCEVLVCHNGEGVIALCWG
jgi:hypothetical protein